MTDQQILDLLTLPGEHNRGPRSLLLDAMWRHFKAIGCNGSGAGHGSRLKQLGLGAYRRREEGSGVFTRNERGAELADKLRELGYRSDGRVYP